MEDYVLPEFDMLGSMKGAQKIVVIGSPGSGKSWFVMDLMYTFSHEYPVCKIFSGSEIHNPFYCHFVDPHYIVNGYVEKEMNRFIHRQEEVLSEEGNAKAILVVDDCNKNPKIYKTEQFYDLIQNSRHWGNKTVIAVQHPRFIAKEVASIASWIVLYKETNDDLIDRLYSEFGGATKSKAAFRQLMNSLKQYECLVINNENKSAKHQVFYYMPRNRNPLEGKWWRNKKGRTIKFGCREFREWAKLRTDTNWRPNLTKKYG